MVPEGWNEVRFGEVLSLEYGKSLPSRERQEGDVDVYGSAGPIGSHDEALLDGPGIVVGRKGSIGEATWVDGPFWPIDTTYYVVPQPDLDLRFCYYVLNFRDLEALNRATGIPGLNRHDVAALPLPLPPLPEQKKIAAILSSVEDAIAATQKVIEQAKRVKKGLLRDLMIRGIGQMQFKKTEIGEIPEEWEVVRLEDVSARGSGHTPSKSHPEYWNGNIKWVSLADSPALDRVYLAETDKTITAEGIANSSAVLHPPGTVFVSRDASVGRSAIAACELAVSQHFIAWQCGERLDNHFLYYFLQFHKPQFERFAVGSTIKTIGLRYFKRLEIPLPPVAEQKAIARTLLSHDEYIWQCEDVAVELDALKRGLMQDLLTGRVRVPVD